jgi:hypothetical protein
VEQSGWVARWLVARGSWLGGSTSAFGVPFTEQGPTVFQLTHRQFHVSVGRCDQSNEFAVLTDTAKQRCFLGTIGWRGHERHYSDPKFSILAQRWML